MTITIYTDGGSRGNPGHAAMGIYIIDEHKNVLYKRGEYLGKTTNNVAEYKAIIHALSWLAQNFQKLGIEKAQVYMDSLLIISQINNVFKVKNQTMKELILQVREQEYQIPIPLLYTHIPREKNKEADALVNLALDNHIKASYNRE